MSRVPAMRTLENALRRDGFCLVAGVDEVGRGCLAGPVTAAAVILDPKRHIPGLADSKAVPADERADLYDEILRRAVAWAVASSEPTLIDQLDSRCRGARRRRRARARLPDRARRPALG